MAGYHQEVDEVLGSKADVSPVTSWPTVARKDGTVGPSHVTECVPYREDHCDSTQVSQAVPEGFSQRPLSSANKAV